MSSGWSVNVRAKKSDNIEASATYFARVSDRQEAEHAIRAYLNAPAHVIEARLPIQSSVFDALNISNGQVVVRQADKSDAIDNICGDPLSTGASRSTYRAGSASAIAAAGELGHGL